MVRVVGNPLSPEDALRFMDELQASSKTQLVRASAKNKWLRMAEPPSNGLQQHPGSMGGKSALSVSTCVWHFRFDSQEPADPSGHRKFRIGG
jgi:hypothetical protein